MRVASATGSPVGGDTELMREVASAMRDGPHQPTVVQSILTMHSQILQRLDVLVRQGGGHAAGPPAAGSRGGGDMEQPIHDALLRISLVLDRIERITASEGGGRGGGSRYFTKESEINAINIIRRLTQSQEENIRRNEKEINAVSSFGALIKQEAENSVKNLAVSFLNLGGSVSNLQGSFRKLEQSIKEQITSARDTGAFGSNALSPQQFFLEGLTRVQHGMLTGFDSFRTSLQLVNDSLEKNLISPLTMTGRTVDELAGDLHQARENMRERYGFDTRAWMSTQDANKAMSALVDMQQKFGVNATIRDMRTEMAAARDGSFLKVISSNTGETVTKLEAQLQMNREQQDVLIGMGRMNESEFKNFTANQTEMQKMFGKNGEAFAGQIAGMMRYGRSASEVISNPTTPPEMRTMAATMPQMFGQMMRISEAMMHSQLTPDQMRALLRPLGAQQGGAAFQGMGPAAQGVLFPGMMDQLARMTLIGNQAGAQRSGDARQVENQKDNSTWAMLQHFTESFQEYVKPFLRVEVALLSNVAALTLNSMAIGRLAMVMMARGGGETVGGIGSMMMRGANTAIRGASPILGGLGGAAAAYMDGAPALGIAGAGVGGAGGAAIGAAIGSAIVPVIGTALGGIVGGLIGSYGGQKLGTSLSGEGPKGQEPTVVQVPAPGMAGPGAPQTALFEQTAADTSSLVGILSRILTTNETEVGYLAQIKGELTRQTSYLTGAPSPAGAAPVGTGLTASTVSSVQSRGSRPDSSTAYSGAG